MTSAVLKGARLLCVARCDTCDEEGLFVPVPD